MFFKGSDPATIDVDGRVVPILVRRHEKARGYKLRLDRTGAARLTMPARGSERKALAWAREQGAWIAEQLGRMEQQGATLCDGGQFLLEGRPTTIRWQADWPRRIRQEGDELLVGGPADHLGERVLRWLRLRAKEVLTAETLALTARHGLSVVSVGIGDPASRWGSCTASGAIRYSWRLILAPPEVRISTVAHEVAHLRHLDHSPAFHAFHRSICPSDTAAARAWLKAHGAALHRVGV
ncbi:M48 family metallopeptidase [Sphingobium sufflavum]|uniref:M48 family metallopeptidase n=1 Tax=Sphingobium sufflavum TaxID=1129547 RepID=UPI001F31FAA7|nr:SprT family zinc-dependent metalloprotease [Sphingobium sufflavum]MCE7795056.1 M48 family metallopeptidase [Sphingobium sufflavum]